MADNGTDHSLLDEEFQNPLDRVEELLTCNNWVFNRIDTEELMVKVMGKHCAYYLYFVWDDMLSALQFSCHYDKEINPRNMDRAAATLLSINEELWLGHFDIDKDTKLPCFRHTCLLRGLSKDGGFSAIEDMVDIGLGLCERHYYAFYLLSHANDATDQNLSLALMETAGEC